MNQTATTSSEIRSRVYTFVLVHGAWHGAWCYARIRTALQARGHTVFTPTLTGLADRSHLLSSDIALNTHISDVANLVRWENLDQIVLVGHSYGSWVITGAAEELQGRVAGIVFIDGYIPSNGERLLDHGRPGAAEEVIQAMEAGRPGRPSPTAADFGVMSPDDRVWVDSKTTDQPVGVSFQPIRLTGAVGRIPTRAYIRAQAYESERFDRIWRSLDADPEWLTFMMSCGHDVMIDKPDELTDILIHVAAARFDGARRDEGTVSEGAPMPARGPLGFVENTK